MRYIGYKTKHQIMIIAKLNTGITIVKQDSPFSQSTSATYMWFTASVPRYLPGAATYGVNVIYGDAVEENSIPTSFIRKGVHKVDFTNEELSTWGTDDNAFISIVATKVGLSISNTYEVPDTL